MFGRRRERECSREWFSTRVRSAQKGIMRMRYVSVVCEFEVVIEIRHVFVRCHSCRVCACQRHAGRSSKETETGRMSEFRTDMVSDIRIAKREIASARKLAGPRKHPSTLVVVVVQDPTVFSSSQRTK